MQNPYDSRVGLMVRLIITCRIIAGRSLALQYFYSLMHNYYILYIYLLADSKVHV